MRPERFSVEFGAKNVKNDQLWVEKQLEPFFSSYLKHLALSSQHLSVEAFILSQIDKNLEWVPLKVRVIHFGSRTSQTSWRFIMIHHSSWWVMINHAISLYFMKYRDNAWEIMRNQDISLYVMKYNAFSWNIMIIHDNSWELMIFHDISWNIMWIHGISWNIVGFHENLWEFMIFSGSRQYAQGMV